MTKLNFQGHVFTPQQRSIIAEREDMRRYYRANHRDAQADFMVDCVRYYIAGLTGNLSQDFDGIKRLMAECYERESA